MKLVVTSDWHADWSTLGVRRFDEVERAVHEAVSAAIIEKADAFVCLGDLADPDTGGDTFRAQRLAVFVALKLAHYGVRSIWVAGNHDVCEDGTGASVLEPLRAHEDFNRALEKNLVVVAAAPRVVDLDDEHAMLCLPFAPVSHGVDVAQAARELWPTGKRVVVASHLTVPGIVAGEETNDMPRGREVLYPFEETKRALLRLSGHYHRRQIFDPNDGGPPIHVVGTLARLSFSEEEYEPGYLVIDL